jgi:hypothetical protein
VTAYTAIPQRQQKKCGPEKAAATKFTQPHWNNLHADQLRGAGMEHPLEAPRHQRSWPHLGKQQPGRQHTHHPDFNLKAAIMADIRQA